MSLKKRVKSFQYAFHGLFFFFRSEVHAQIHLVAFFVTLALGFYLKINTTEWCIILLCSALVLSLEAVNTALEQLTNLASPDYHPLAGKTKDVAAGAVLIASIIAAIIGGIIFLPKILPLISSN